jgi:ketosteroid isomerase-like protein
LCEGAAIPRESFLSILEITMNSDFRDFAAFMTTRASAAQAFVNGNVEPMSSLLTSVSPATFFGPGGGVDEGPEQVFSTFKSQAAPFESGQSDFQIHQMAANGELAYWVGLQRVSARQIGKPEMAQFHLRVTELFRKEDGKWKLVHRHADALKA